ncbi:MAG: hypothetical protein GXY33_00575 [Phycisphaerae bacterium]|nr:hypothetical protein [Phycisphaerae bacterium]
MSAGSSGMRAAWLAEGTYGVMVHYLVSPDGRTATERTRNLNRIIDGFDVDGFIGEFLATGADWLIFTIGQNTGYYNSPNAFLDPRLPGRTPQRDLVRQIAGRLAERQKKLIVYIPGDMACKDPDIRAVFGWDESDHREFLDRYPRFVREYSLQYGPLVHGWWFDGCYEWIHKGEWDWSLWLAAARAGNPDSITAFNDGAFCLGRIKPLTPLEEYHAGEVHVLENGAIRTDFLDVGSVAIVDGKLRTPGRAPELYMPESQFVDGVQWHALVPIDSTFNPAVPEEFCRYGDEELFGFVSACKGVKGAVTLNVPIERNGRIPPGSLAQLHRLGHIICG